MPLFSRLTSFGGPPPRPGTRAFEVVKAVTALNVRLFRLTGGRIGGTFDGVPVLLLHHVGRRSGEPRVTPLLHIVDGDDLVIVASMGGTPKHPAWYHNLTAAPDAEVELARERRAVRARTATPQEKGRLWPRLVDAYPAYAVYQRRTDRDIPVVLLERRA